MLPSSGTCPAPGRSIRSRCQEDSLLLLLLLFSCFVLLLFPLFSLLLFYSIPSIYYLRPILRLSPFRNCEGSHCRHFSRRPPARPLLPCAPSFLSRAKTIVKGSGLTPDYRYIAWYARSACMHVCYYTATDLYCNKQQAVCQPMPAFCTRSNLYHHRHRRRLLQTARHNHSLPIMPLIPYHPALTYNDTWGCFA